MRKIIIAVSPPFKLMRGGGRAAISMLLYKQFNICVSQLIQVEIRCHYKKACGRYGRRQQRGEEQASLSVKKVESIMLRILKKKPNTSILSICALVLSVVFLLGIVTAPPGNRLNEAMKDKTVAAMPPPGLSLEWFIDYRVPFPQDF